MGPYITAMDREFGVGAGERISAAGRAMHEAVDGRDAVANASASSRAHWNWLAILALKAAGALPASPEDAELVERLLEPGDLHGGWLDTMREAAARLSALSAELERVKKERDEEVTRLQAALMYWMPSVTPETDTGLERSAGDDAYLLAGFNGPAPSSCWGNMMLAKVSRLREALEPFAFRGMTWRHGNKVHITVATEAIERARTVLGDKQ